jgi:Tol biopolymer transport system component
MKRNFSAALYLVILLSLSGCSMDISQPVAETLPTESVLADSTSVSGLNETPSSSSSSTRPVTWAGLNLTGRLVYGRLSSSDDISALSMETLDLTTGEIRKIFTVPEDGWIYYAAVSPDGKQLIISYVASFQSNSTTNQALYILPMDGSAAPQLFITPPTQYDQYLQVEWSPDGKYVYYVYNNYNAQPADQIYPSYKIFRVAYPNGQPEQIAENAFWPRVSPDSSRLVYVSLDPASGLSELFLADAGGSNARIINLAGPHGTDIKDAPIFSPDGQSILFSAPSPGQSYQPNWFDKLMGVRIAKAHSIPSDWWSVPITGGEPTRLTAIQSTNLFASLSPDEKHLVSYSLEGLFVMELDGSNLTSLIPDPGGSTVNWLP